MSAENMCYTLSTDLCSVDRAALLDDRRFANGFALTTDNAALSIGNNHAELHNSVYTRVSDD